MAIFSPLVIVVLTIVRTYFQPFAQWVIATGTPTHAGFGLAHMALALAGIVAMFIARTPGKAKALYLLLMVLAVAAIGSSHMSAHESATHTVANIGMRVFPILAVLTAALSNIAPDKPGRRCQIPAH